MSETLQGAPPQSDLERQQLEAMAIAAMRGSTLRLYANGFLLSQSASDFSIILMLNGAPAGVLSLSAITAKTLALGLQKSVEDFEKLLKQKIPTIEEVQNTMTDNQGSGYVKF